MGAEGLCSDAIAVGACGRQLPSHSRRNQGTSGTAGIKVNQSLGSLLVCWLLQGAQLTLEPMPTPCSLCHSSRSSHCKQPRCAKGVPASKCHIVCTSSHFTHLWELFFSLQNTSSSPLALGLLLEKLSDVERPGHDSPGCFWGRGAALGEWQDQPPVHGFSPSPHRTASKGHSPQQFPTF